MVQKNIHIQRSFVHCPSLKRLIALTLILAITSVSSTATAHAVPAAPTNYYVDCLDGSDNNAGISATQAWRTLDRANEGALLPGDALYFKRGCSWAGKLLASWNGTASARIRIGAYGSGALPLIYNRPEDLLNQFHNNVLITGSYLIVENLATTIVNPPTDPNCGNNPIGFYIGFNFVNANNSPNGASNNTLRYVKAYGHTVGIHLNNGANNNRIVFNTITENRAMTILTPKAQNPTDDLGAWGILVKGDNNDIARNYLANNNALCTYDTAPHGNTIEIYEGQNNRIHHNMAVNDRVFSELGGSAARRAQNNTYYYNVVISDRVDARFIVARGNGHSFGPTQNTQIFHNTVYFTNPLSQGIVCGANCDDTILKAQGNIIWAEEKAIFADGAINERRNIFWSSNGVPVVQLMSSIMDAQSIIADPRFVSPVGRDFTLLSTSPAINAAKIVRCSRDINNNSVPTVGLPDIGSLEWQTQTSNGAAMIENVGADIVPISDEEFERIMLEDTLLEELSPPEELPYQTLLPTVLR